MTQILFLGLMFAAMYFLMIAPQRKKQKQHEAMLKALQAGDEHIKASWAEVLPLKYSVPAVSPPVRIFCVDSRNPWPRGLRPRTNYVAWRGEPG